MKHYRHRNKGQALAEGAAFLLFLVPLGVGLVLLLLVTATISYYKLKLIQVADAGARAAAQERYWLGSQRPDFDPSSTGQSAQNVLTVCKAVWSQLGIPGTPNYSVDFSQPTTASVTVTVSGLPIISGGFLPPMLALQDKAVQPYSIERPIGVVALLYTTSSGAIGQGWALPSYGAGNAEPGPQTFPQSSVNGHFPYWGICWPGQYFFGPGNFTTYGPLDSWEGGGPFTGYAPPS